MIPESFSLTGRVALVTGAGSPTGIGFASARLLGRLGAAVAITSTTERIQDRAAELTDLGIDCFGSAGDLTDEATANRLVAEAVERFGSVDILVNNAGMTSVSVPGAPEAGSVSGISVSAWRASIERNLDTAFLMARAVVPGMAAAGWGRIISIASVSGPVMAMRHEVAYAAAKAGVVGLSRALALDHGRDGITVNAVAPGWIATGSQTDHEAAEGLTTPVGRSGTADEVAAAVAWLASPGGAYTTGQCVVVDGGNSIAEERR